MYINYLSIVLSLKIPRFYPNNRGAMRAPFIRPRTPRTFNAMRAPNPPSPPPPPPVLLLLSVSTGCVLTTALAVVVVVGLKYYSYLSHCIINSFPRI